MFAKFSVSIKSDLIRLISESNFSLSIKRNIHHSAKWPLIVRRDLLVNLSRLPTWDTEPVMLVICSPALEQCLLLALENISVEQKMGTLYHYKIRNRHLQIIVGHFGPFTLHGISGGEYNWSC